MDHTQRQVLPSSAAVKQVRFTTADHERSRIVRETLDSFDTPLRCAPVAPRVDADHHHESIVLEGAEVRRTMRTGSHAVRQTFTTPLELDTTPAPLAFEVVADSTLQTDAANALAALNDRKRKPARKRTEPQAAGWVSASISLGVVIIAALVVYFGVTIATR